MQLTFLLQSSWMELFCLDDLTAKSFRSYDFCIEYLAVKKHRGVKSKPQICWLPQPSSHSSLLLMRLRSVEDPSRKLWIGNIPEQAKWKDLQALVDQAALGSGNVWHGR
jgi:hypothetical protein